MMKIVIWVSENKNCCWKPCPIHLLTVLTFVKEMWCILWTFVNNVTFLWQTMKFCERLWNYVKDCEVLWNRLWSLLNDCEGLWKQTVKFCERLWRFVNIDCEVLWMTVKFCERLWWFVKQIVKFCRDKSGCTKIQFLHHVSLLIMLWHCAFPYCILQKCTKQLILENLSFRTVSIILGVSLLYLSFLRDKSVLNSMFSSLKIWTVLIIFRIVATQK